MPAKPPTIRLSGKKSFKTVFAGKRFATSDLVFYFSPSPAGTGRMGLVIGRKAYAGAVTRNRLKRRLRDLFRRHYGELGGHDVIMIAKRGRQEPEYGNLERQFARLAGELRQ